MDKIQQQEIFSNYSANNMSKLKQQAHSCFKRFSGISEVDYVDFYSIANEVLWSAANEYDSSKNVPFENFFKFKLYNKFKTEMTKRNREKRCNKEVDQEGNCIYKYALSIEAIAEKTDYIDELVSDDDIESMVLEEIKFSENNKINMYLDRLSKRQKKIVLLLSNGFQLDDIKEMMKLHTTLFANDIKSIRSYENIKVLL